MYAQRDAGTEEAKRLRKRGGRYLKELRERAEITQRDLAEAVGMRYYTFISQLENGTGRVPPDQLEAFASALGVDVGDFAKKLLMYYDPHYYKALFGLPTKGDLDPLR